MSDPRTQFTSLKPYLTLPQLFSLTWLAYPVISLLFVAFRLHASSGSAQDAVADAKSTLLASCRAAEKAATAAASLPRFLAQGTNDQIVDAVNGTLNGARGALMLSLTIMQGIIEFIVDMYRSTFLCFLELVVRGGLHVLIGASQEVTSFIQGTLQTIGSGLQDQVNVVNTAINGAISVINGVGGIFGGGINIQPISLNLDGLANIQIPNTFTNALTELNSTIPTLDELRDAVDKVISIPFDRVKSEINETFSTISFDTSVLPVPQTNTMSFCSSLDISVVDRLGADLIQITKIAFILLIVLIILLILANCALEWWKYRTLMNNLQTTREAWMSDPIVGEQQPTPQSAGVPTVTMTDYNLLELHAATNHPLLMLFTNKLSALLRLSRSQHIHMRWFFAYVFHPPALALFLIGFFGLLSVQLQLAAIGPLENKYNGEVADTVSNFTLLIGDSINGSMQNDSIAYATAVNTQVDGIQTTINEGMFGWVEDTTSALNNTLVTFYAEIQTAIDKVFGGTVLEQPIEEFMFCLIGSKVVAFENALTFLHDNLRVDLPRANENVLMISQASMDEVARPVALAAVGDQNEADGESSDGLVGRIVSRYVSSLKKERTMFLVMLGLWGFVVLMALAIIFYHSYLLPAMERRKKAQWHREARSFEASPWRSTTQLDEKGGSFDRSRTPSPFSPPLTTTAPVLGWSDRRRKQETSSWDDESKPTSPASGDQSSGRKLISFGRKFRRGDTFILNDGAANPSGPTWWDRARKVFTRKDEEEDDWLAGSATQIKSVTPLTPRLSKLVSPPPPHSAMADFAPQFKRKTPPPILSVPKPPPKGVPAIASVTGIENYKFPSPPRVTPAPMPMPLHHGFARQVPSDLPRSPMDFLNVETAHARKSSQTFDPHMIGLAAPQRSQNPFSTPFDEPEASPFASAADRREVSPFADINAAMTPPAHESARAATTTTTTTNPFLNPANVFGRAV